jgi:hypothetical protein
MARTISERPPVWSSVFTKERSIFRVSTGRFCR